MMEELKKRLHTMYTCLKIDFFFNYIGCIVILVSQFEMEKVYIPIIKFIDV